MLSGGWQAWSRDLARHHGRIVGLEVKHELVLGELADRRRAAVPAIAALVGLAVPALLFVAFNASDGQAGAWGVVISTDTAFVLGALALLGSAVPSQLRVFLLAIAIGDDVGALTVIAVFYTDQLDLVALAVAVAGVLAMVALRELKVWRGPAYLALGVVSWVALYLSGVHPTLLGVAVVVVPPGTPADVTTAVRRALDLVGTRSGFAGLCDRLACLAYGFANSGYYSAAEHWSAMVRTGHARPGDRCPPVGSFVFWSTSRVYGHVALVVQADAGCDPSRIQVVSNDVLDSRTGFDGGVYLVSLAQIESGFVSRAGYLGWSDPVCAGSPLSASSA